ncbi:MAG: hypothetical protein ACM3JE_04035 [Betaproteobacteria bacterium]
MSEVQIDVLETLQKANQKISEYLNKAKASPSDTEVKIERLGFNIGKKEKEYNVSMEMDFILLPKTENDKLSETT